MNDGPTLNFPRLEPPQVPRSVVRVVVPILLLLVVLSSSFYQVEPEEVGVVVRLGKYVGQAPPGLHFKIPFADQVYLVPVQRQLNEELGFQSRNPELRVGTSRDSALEANMLTGDLNAALVQWVVQYRIVDPYLFLFKVRSPRETFRDMSEAVMREVVGDRTVNEVLTVGRQEVTEEVSRRLQERCDQYEIGLAVDQVVLQEVTPPELVKPAFNEVNQAQQERERMINQAQAEYNQVIPRARGEAQQTIEEARGYALDRVNRARGEAARFNSLFAAYREAPEVTQRRIYLETMGQVIPTAGRKVVVGDDMQGMVPLLDLTGTVPKSAAAAGGGS